MLYVDDSYYDSAFFESCDQGFNKISALKNCAGKRFTVCMSDAAKWIALCLYLKSHGASVLPLPVDTPLEAARNRAIKSGSHYLLYQTLENKTLENFTVINEMQPNVDPGLVQMSSGTTGEPKYIDRSWQSIDEEIEAYIKHFPEGNTMPSVVACPVNHSYGLICGVLVALKRGWKPFIVQNNNPKYLIKKLEEVKSAILYSSPTLISTISMLAKNKEPFHAVMTSGTLMQRKWLEKVSNVFVHVYQQYGCSETGCISIAKDIKTVSQIGSPLPHIKVTSGTGEENTSEILVEKSNGQIINTHDLGYFDGGGQLHFVSRLDDMINVSGLNVYPAEVEEVVMAMPQITDAVIFKRKHTFGNDQVCLNYVSEYELEDNDIRQWCRQKLANYQIPMAISRVSEIPRLPNGKVSRKKIAEAYAS